MAPVRTVAEFFMKRAVSPTPLFKELCVHLLQLATSLGVGESSILESLKPTKAWNVMGDELCRHFVRNTGAFVPAALRLTNGAVPLMTQVLNYVLRDKTLVSMVGSTMSSEIASPRSPHFETLFAIFPKAAGTTEKPLLLIRSLCWACFQRLPLMHIKVPAKSSETPWRTWCCSIFLWRCQSYFPGPPNCCPTRRQCASCWLVSSRPGSTMLLELLLRVLYREDKNHFLEPEVLLSLRRTMPQCSEAKQLQLLNSAYKCAATLRGLPTPARLSIASKLLPQLLKHSSKSSLRQFFVENVVAIPGHGRIKDTIGATISPGLKEGCCHFSDVLFKQLVRRVMTSLYDVGVLLTTSLEKQSAINNSFCRAREVATVVGNELTKEVTKHTNMLKKERGELGGDEENAYLWRHLRCAAYNVIAAVVSCTQVEAQFYDVFLFQEKPEKGEFVWNNITDEKKTYKFPLELEAPSRRNRQVVGMTEAAPDDGNKRESNKRRSLSWSLLGSSLAKEASQYSLSASGLAFWDIGESNKSIGSGAEKAPEEDVPKFRKMKVVDLEDDDLNRHDCMAMVCSVIEHMASIGIICKTVEVYVHQLLPVILDILARKKLGSELDAFVIDLVVTVLTWTADLDAKDLKGLGVSNQAQSVLEFLVTHCGHQRSDIQNTQLELVNAWVGTWKKQLRFPGDTILQLCEAISLDGKDARGVFLFGIFVKNDLVDFLEIQDYSLERILDRLPKLLAGKHRLLYTTVADVVGLTFCKMNEGAGIDNNFLGSVESNLAAILKMGQRDQYVLVLNRICRLYEPFARSFTETMMLQLPRALASFKVAILEVIAMACIELDKPVQKLEGLGFIDMLAHGDDGIQKVALDICVKLTTVATEQDWHVLLPVICKLQVHANVSCRKLVYDVCMRLYTKYRSSERGADLMKQARRVLLLGLGDADLPLRLLVANFWCQETRLPRATTERLVALLGDMYLPESEEQFLSSSTFLLLELTSRSPDYDRKVFQHPLSDCTFVDYAVTGSWRRRHAAMTPLFAETLSFSQTQSTSTQSSTTEGVKSQRLRATQATLQFTPTQQTGASGTY
ncbi:hypothetical protein MRX96_043377 [Rhipicephalus microplus]